MKGYIKTTTLKKVLIMLGMSLGIIGISLAALLLKHPFTKSDKPADKTAVPSKISALIKDVDQKAALPPDEVPTVATITDLSKLDQPFFLKAEKGDKILMFISSKQAFLYRPSTKEVINHGALDIVTKDASESAEASASAKNTNPSVLRIKF